MTTEMHPRYGSSYVPKFKTKASRQRGNTDRTLFEVMREVIDSLPNAGTEEILSAAEKEVMTDGDLIEQAVKHALVNVHASVKRAQREENDVSVKSDLSVKSGSVKSGQIAAQKEKVERVMSQAREIGKGMSESISTILDFTMPNGKQLRNCTFGEVAECGARFSQIARLGKPHQLVGEVINAKQAANL